MLDLAVAGSATVLPAVLDFDRDREASPARMNRAMEYLYLRLAAATALQPEFESAIGELQAVGLDRLNEVLGPIFAEATSVAAQLDAIKVAFLTGQPLAQLLADLESRVAGRLTAVDAQLASNLNAVTAKLGAVDTKLAELSPPANGASAPADEARAATAQRLISAAILWAMLEPVPLTDAALIPVDLSKGVHFTLPLGGNRTLAAPTGGKPGQEGFIRVVQDGAGGRTLSFAAAYRFPDLATAPSLNAGAGAVTLLRYHVSATGEVFISGGKPGSSTPTAGYTPGWYYGSPRSLQFNQSYNLQGGTVLFQPLVITKAVTISRLGVTTGNSNINNMRLGLYDSVAGKPNALLTQTAMFATSSAYSPNPQNCPTVTLQPGVYWIAIGGDNSWSAACTNSDATIVEIVGIQPAFSEGGMPLLGGQGSVGTNGLPAIYSTANGVSYMMTIYNIWFVAS